MPKPSVNHCRFVLLLSSLLLDFLVIYVKQYSIIYVHIYSNQFGLTPKLYASTFCVCIKFMRYVIEHDHVRVHERYVFFFCHQNYINTNAIVHTKASNEHFPSLFKINK